MKYLKDKLIELINKYGNACKEFGQCEGDAKISDDNENVNTIWHGSFMDFSIENIKCWKYLKD
jgi:hypothetical protein